MPLVYRPMHSNLANLNSRRPDPKVSWEFGLRARCARPTFERLATASVFEWHVTVEMAMFNVHNKCRCNGGIDALKRDFGLRSNSVNIFVGNICVATIHRVAR